MIQFIIIQDIVCQFNFNIIFYDIMQCQKVFFVFGMFGYVGMYLCGLIVYFDVYLGYVKKEVVFDVICCVLIYFGYQVCYVFNIIDVGYLLNDVDEGEDKLQVCVWLE